MIATCIRLAVERAARVSYAFAVGIGIDTSHSPIWVIDFPADTTVEDYREHLERFIGACEAGQRYGLLLDLRDFNPLERYLETKRGMSEALAARMDAIAPAIACEARVIPNPVVRAMATVFDWRTACPWPINNASSGDRAEGWVRAQLEKLGIEPPAEAVWRDRGPGRSRTPAR